MHPFTYHRPESLQRALAALDTPRAVPLGGGTDLLVTMKEELVRPEHLVDLRHLKGARDMEFRDDGSARLGAAVRIADLAAAVGAAPPRALVLQVNGAFHSDYALGTALRARRRLKGKRVAIVSFVPVTDLDTADGKAGRKLGDYVVFTLAPKKTEK